MVDEKGFTHTLLQKTKKFEAVMFYKTNEDGTVEQKMVNVNGTPEGINAAETLAAGGFSTDNAEASALLQERFSLKAEGRAEDSFNKSRSYVQPMLPYLRKNAEMAEFDRRAAEAELGVIRADKVVQTTQHNPPKRAHKHGLMWSVVKTLYRQLPQKSVQTTQHYPPKNAHKHRLMWIARKTF
jgi:hypothetical protein